MTPGRLKIWNEDAGEWQYAPGGSQPGTVRRLDLGVIEVAAAWEADLTLWTPAAGEVAHAIFSDLEFASTVHSVWVTRADGGKLALWDSDLVVYAGQGNIGDGAGANVDPLTLQPVADTAITLAISGDGVEADFVECERWQANHGYAAFTEILAEGHLWTADADGGTSGGSAPDFAGNFGGTVTDNDITWTDQGEITGSVHIYLDVCVPVAYP